LVFEKGAELSTKFDNWWHIRHPLLCKGESAIAFEVEGVYVGLWRVHGQADTVRKARAHF
jgi:hypothetical protein